MPDKTKGESMFGNMMSKLKNSGAGRLASKLKHKATSWMSKKDDSYKKIFSEFATRGFKLTKKQHKELMETGQFIPTDKQKKIMESIQEYVSGNIKFGEDTDDETEDEQEVEMKTITPDTDDDNDDSNEKESRPHSKS